MSFYIDYIQKATSIFRSFFDFDSCLKDIKSFILKTIVYAILFILVMLVERNYELNAPCFSSDNGNIFLKIIPKKQNYGYCKVSYAHRHLIIKKVGNAV